MVRVGKHLDMLKQNADVYTIVVKEWRSRAFVDTLLALRYSKQGLARATPKAKIEMVYQCGIVEEFETVQEELKDALQAERGYQRCDYRRATFKALENLVTKYNVAQGEEYVYGSQR